MLKQIKHVRVGEHNVVTAISYLNDDESDKGLIIVSNETDVGIDYIYNQSTQTFSPPEPQPNPERQPTVEEIQAQTLLNTELLLIYKELETGYKNDL